LFEYLYAQNIPKFENDIDESSNFEELREIVDLQWLADFLGCGQIAKWAERVIDDHANSSHAIDLWKRNPNKFHDTLANMMREGSMEPEYQQSLLNGIRLTVSKIENSDELDRFLELMNVNESCDEETESSGTKHCEAASQTSEPVSKRLRNSANELIEVKSEAVLSCEAPYCKLQIQLAWFLQGENKNSEFEYMKKCLFNTNFEHKDFDTESKCKFFQSIVGYLDDSDLKKATAHIFRKGENDSQPPKNYSEKLSGILTVLKPSDEELAEMTKLSIDCGDATTKKSLEAIKKKRESQNLDEFDSVFNIGDDDPDNYNFYSYDPETNGKLCWTDFIDETVGKVTWKVHIYTISKSNPFSIGVQIITEENMSKRNKNQNHRAKFYSWTTKQRGEIDDHYHPRAGVSKSQIINHKIENPPDVIEKIENEPEHQPGIDYKYGGFGSEDNITVVFDRRNKTIEFLKNDIASTSKKFAFTGKDIVKGRARFFIQMGSPDDAVMIRNYEIQ
jgi:hypothetical protein